MLCRGLGPCGRGVDAGRRLQGTAAVQGGLRLSIRPGILIQGPSRMACLGGMRDSPRQLLIPPSARPPQIFPQFVDEALAVGGVRDKGARYIGVEQGEGHGPRKEFFLLVGQELRGAAGGSIPGTPLPDGSPVTGQQQRKPSVPGRGTTPLGIADGSMHRGSAFKSGGNGTLMLPDLVAERGAALSRSNLSHRAVTAELSPALQPPAEPAASASARQRPMLAYVRSAGAYWLDRQQVNSPAAATTARIVGWLLGQALANRAVLGVPLPAQLFQALVGGDQWRPSIDNLARFDPDAAQSLLQLKSLSAAEFQEFALSEGRAAGITFEASASPCPCKTRAAARPAGAWRPTTPRPVPLWIRRPICSRRSATTSWRRSIGC